MDRTPGRGQDASGGAGGTGGAAGVPGPRGARKQAPDAGAAAVPYGAAEADASHRAPQGYRLLRRVGEGRHSTVLLCRDEAGGQEVAVKLLRPAVPDEGVRLAAHAELLSAGAAAKHPCSVLVEDAGFTDEGHPYLVEQFCRGGNAQAKLSNSGAFPVDEVVVIGARAALSIASSHRRGVLHLDVRPANVLFDESGDALLADHGVARVLQRATAELGAVFDPMYASREMFGWEKPGPAADVYGLGATLYALLNGVPAYAEAGSTSWSALYGEVLRGELPPLERPDVPPRLEGLVRRMMAAHPEGRPPLTEVHRELRQLLVPAYRSRVPALDPEPAPEPVLPGWDPADDVTPQEQEEVVRIGREAEAELRRRSRRRIAAAATATVVFAAAATAMTLLMHHRHRTTPRAGTPHSAPAGTPHPVPAAERAALVPQGVTATRADASIEVTWRPPRHPSAVEGYVVQSLPVGAKLPGSRTPDSPAERRVVFSDAGSLRPDTCFTVVALISTSGGVEYASSAPQCHLAGR